MEKVKLSTTRISLWLIFFFFSLFCQGQEALAQFGLFDTVWTTKNFLISGSGHSTISSNDSLLFLFKPGKYAVLDDTSEKYVLIRTLNLQDTVWYISNFPTQNEPLRFIENDSKILFDTRTWTVPRTDYVNSCIITRDANTFQVVDSVAFDYWTYPPNTGSCYKFYCGVSEIDTSVYYWGYCGHTAIKGISYKVNYRTGQTSITSDSLPYFAMTISEDGQYVAGVYYTGGTASNVPYNEVLEVRKISDYSLVFRESKYYCDYTSNFYPYSWVTNYKLKFSKDNKYLLKHVNYQGFLIYCIETSETILLNTTGIIPCKSFSSDSKTFFYERDINKKIEYHLFDLEQKVDRIVQNTPDYPLIIGGSEGFIFNDNYLLAGATSIYPTDYFNFKQLGPTLLQVNFDLNSIQELENPIYRTLYPNPTNNKINFSFELKSTTQLNYSIYSETGQIIKLLLNEYTEVGVITKIFDVSDLPPGIYFLKITGKNFSQTYKVIINR